MSARITRDKELKYTWDSGIIPAGGEWVSRLDQVVTLEVALYAGALLLGAAMRLLLLDARPLSIQEGNLALEAFNIAIAQPLDAIQQGPLLAFGTALSLMLFGGGDAAARLLPAIFGSALVALPFLLRSSIGRVPALISAYGIALSPLMLFASRDLGSGMLSLSLGGFLVAALIRGLKNTSKLQAYAVAVLLAGLITSGVEGINVLLTLSIAALLAHPQPASLLANIRSAAVSPIWRRAALLFAVTVLILSTGMGARPGGAQWALADVWVNWAGSLSLSAPRGGLLALLALYEMPVLLLGITQLARTMFRRQHIDMFLSLWLMLLLLTGMVQQTESASRLILPALPLYLLAARLVSDSSVITRYTGRGWRWTTTCTMFAVPIAIAIVLLNRTSTSGMEIPSPFLHGEAVLIIVAVLAVAFLLRGKERLALGWYAFAILSVGFVLHTTVFLNYRMESVGREPVIGSQVTPSLRDAAKEAAYFSRYYSQTVTVDPDLKKATQWYLREAPNVQYSLDASGGISFALIRTGQNKLEQGSERRPGIIMPGIDPRNLTWRGTWAWLITRDGLVTPNQRDIIIRSPAGGW